MATSKEGRRAFDINSVLKGCLTDESPEKGEVDERKFKMEEKIKLKSENKSEDIRQEKPVSKVTVYGSENSAPIDYDRKVDDDIRDDVIPAKRRSHEEDERKSPKKMRLESKSQENEQSLERPEYNASAFRKVGKNVTNLENDNVEALVNSHWERVSSGVDGERKSLGLPPTVAPPTYLAQQGVNLFNPFLGLNMLQQADVTSMLSNKPQIFNDQNLLDAFGRSVSAMPTPLTESFANVKGSESGDEPTFSNLKNRFPFNQIINPMVEKLIHKNTSPLLIHSPINAANLSQNWCAKCNASFRMTSDLVYHMRSHHKREFDPVKKKREETYKLKCDICNETFKERHHLTRHMTSHL
ncbi:uncharacterized protein LOC126814130 isoform X1 [Patella vulgata]|uniref:uncharacterized protein LOC126814130 isoform X1 n=2 Tax=Patella vulgata TaxID=6465 RepID=UPI00217F38BD|nr:uncharacterized protein LOC126814130 isoform X1 [Patella vulgata]